MSSSNVKYIFICFRYIKNKLELMEHMVPGKYKNFHISPTPVARLTNSATKHSWLTWIIYQQIFYSYKPPGNIFGPVTFKRERGGSGVIFACLPHMKVPFIAKQPLFTEQDIAPCQKVIRVMV